MTTKDARQERRYADLDRPDDQRTRGQRDRDRILYTSSFRRLAGVTQVVSAAEGHIFHNRLTHSLEVAQVARRLAEKLRKEQREVADALGVDEDVVEAAALAHDLGHPPFGHIAEAELDTAVVEEGVKDGFEGNAQTFRVLNKLAVRSVDFPGLDLTRATLNAVLKYPWLRDTSDPKKKRKWGAYSSEQREFDWARQPFGRSERKMAEAELMDWSDDIAYGVHDVEDFYRAGMIPLERLGDPDEIARFLDEVFARWTLTGFAPDFTRDDAGAAFREIIGYAPITEPYAGTREQRAALRTLTAGLIARYVNAVTLKASSSETDPPVRVPKEQRVELTILKELTWHYVILNPALAAQQYGQRRVVRDLFRVFVEAARAGRGHWKRNVLPRGFKDTLEEHEEQLPEAELDGARVRIAADIVASLTEQQAYQMHARLTGSEPGSVLNAIVR